MSNEPKNSDRNWVAGNYCVCFIDLLGQRDALRGQGLLPLFESEEESKEFNAVLRNSIGAIIKLQEQARNMLAGITNPNPNSELRAKLPLEQHSTWDEMQSTRIETQRWSDGVMSFASLGDADIKCKINAVFGIFGLAGALCLLGLATRRPIRGAIEIGWGVELHPGELYGAAVANAYELESNIAQYPRIVVGPEVVKLLEAHAANSSQDNYSQLDRELAILNLGMLVQDADGYWLLHYLSEQFQQAITQDHHAELYVATRKFVFEQLSEHQASLNTKLAFRYLHLLRYFDAHQPAKSV